MTGSIYLKRERKPRVEGGHPWIYSSEIGRVAGNPSPGDVVRIFNHAGASLGVGFFNPNSQITARIISRQEESIDGDFLMGRLKEALRLRHRVVGSDSDGYRLIHGESDGMPGLTIDIYGKVAAIQVLSLGMEKMLPDLLQALYRVVPVSGVILRNDVRVRELEGMAQEVRFADRECEREVVIRENGFAMHVDVWGGQKTGYFLDQRENRAFIATFVAGAEVLDCFSHTGSFAIHAAGYGAAKVVAVDISEDAEKMIKRNAQLNGYQNQISTVCANAFDYLRQESDGGQSFDVVMLDPPAFTKNRASLPAAIRGYKEINLRGLKMTRSGGYLVTSSCSYHLSRDDFLGVITGAASDARRRVKLLAFRGQAMDHPVLPAATETDYLKFAVLEVL